MRMAQLTRTEISSLPADTNVYEGVGKMYVLLPGRALSFCMMARFYFFASNCFVLCMDLSNGLA
ncbi:hypothetical protein GGR55DRAFT_629757, partial [Xylaria sp. FL0064]